MRFGRLLELEIAETLLMTSTDATIALLTSLKAAGVQIAIDDFGKGYCSPAYLRRFPIDKLKIDRACIRDVTAAQTCGHRPGSHPDGPQPQPRGDRQGRETAPQLAFLRGQHCDQIQGYLFSPPLPVPALEHLIRARTTLTTPDETVIPATTVHRDNAWVMWHCGLRGSRTRSPAPRPGHRPARSSVPGRDRAMAHHTKA